MHNLKFQIFSKKIIFSFLFIHQSTDTLPQILKLYQQTHFTVFQSRPYLKISCKLRNFMDLIPLSKLLENHCGATFLIFMDLIPSHPKHPKPFTRSSQSHYVPIPLSTFSPIPIPKPELLSFLSISTATTTTASTIASRLKKT
jgi:hypothetical protein